MEESLKAMYMGFSVLVFVIAMSVLMIMQQGFNDTYEKLVEVINGGYIW